MRSTQAVAAAFLAVVVSACGAGEPQTDEVRENAQPAGVIVSSTSAEARQYFADGMREFDYNRVPEANANFTQALTADPDFTLAHAYAYSTAQNDVEGRAHLARAVELAANASEYERLTVQALDLQQKQDMQGSMQALKTLTEKHPDNSRAWELRAFLLEGAGFIAEARAAYEKALEVNPAHVSVYMYLAQSLTGNQPTDFARAETLLKKAIELEPSESYIHDLLGDVYRQQGNLEGAAASYTRAAELDPTAGGPFQQRAHVNALIGRYAEARADYDAAIGMTKGNIKILYAEYRPFVRLFENDPRGAITEMQALYKSIDGADVQEPDGLRATLLGDMAAVAFHHQMRDVMDWIDRERAAVRARRIAQINTAEFRLQEEKAQELESGFLAAYRGEFAKAEQHAEAYRRLREPEAAANKFWPYYNLKGTIALQQGRNDDAVKYLEQSNPNNIYLNYQMAVAHERAGRKAEARAQYERVTKHNFIPATLALTRREAEAKLKSL